MLESLKVVSIFLASPSDVSAEREIVKEVCDEISLDLGRIQKFTIELKRWETHASPGIDESAQQVINAKIGKDYNIFLGIFGRRFGTPTPKWQSGTEEEFQIAHSNYVTSKSPRIMLYFSNTPVDPYRTDLDQLAKVRNFQKNVRALGVLDWAFTDPSEFRIILRRHLIHEVLDLLSGELRTSTKIESDKDVYFNPLQNYASAQDNHPDVRAHVLLRKGILGFGAASKDISLINTSMVKLGKGTAHFTREINRMNSSGKINPIKAAKEIQRFLDEIQAYSDTFCLTLPRLRQNFESGISNQFRAITILKLTEDVTPTDVIPLVDSLGGVVASIDNTVTGIEGLIGSVSEQPILGNEYEIRRKILIALNTDFLAFLSWSRQVMIEFQSDLVKDFDQPVAI